MWREVWKLLSFSNCIVQQQNKVLLGTKIKKIKIIFKLFELRLFISIWKSYLRYKKEIIMEKKSVSKLRSKYS